jgi:uncharacterized protein YegP (UPF0339 family)
MFTRCHLLVLCGLLSIAAAQWPATLAAQAKADKGKSKEQVKFEVYQDAAKEYRWRLVLDDGKERHVLATSGQGYKAKSDCLHGVKSIQEGAGADKLTFEAYEDKEKKSRWHAKATNGQTVAVSGSSYKTKAECEKAMEMVKRRVAKAPVEEVTKAKAA